MKKERSDGLIMDTFYFVKVIKMAQIGRITQFFA